MATLSIEHHPMHILMLSSTFPYPPSGGTQVRTFNLLKYLNSRHHVILGTVRSPDVTDAEIEELRQHVAELAVFPHPLAPPHPPLTKGGTEGGSIGYSENCTDLVDL